MSYNITGIRVGALRERAFGGEGDRIVPATRWYHQVATANGEDMSCNITGIGVGALREGGGEGGGGTILSCDRTSHSSPHLTHPCRRYTGDATNMQVF